MSRFCPSFPHVALRSPCRRRAPSMRSALESLEGRLVLSAATDMVAPHHIAAHVHATAAPKLSVPIEVTGIDITSVTSNATTGALNIVGTLTGTILGQSFTTPLSGTVTPAKNAKDYPILNLDLQPIDLNLLGLILQTSTIQVNATAQSGNSDLLGNLIYDVLNSAHVQQSDLNTINGDLNGVLAKVVGVLNDTTLTLSSGAVGSLSPPLQELASPTLIDTTGAAVPPEQVLDLNIATNDGSPPVDVDLLGVVVTTSNIDVQLFAQPGNGDVLGNLVYNVSHLLDGGLLGVLSILQGLGV